jgi:hypothetical protein
MSDTLTVEQNAARDAAALVAALHKGDTDMVTILLSLYNDREEMAALCGSLAAFANAILKIIDGIGEEIRTVHGISFPSSSQVLSSVLLRLAEPSKD